MKAFHILAGATASLLATSTYAAVIPVAADTYLQRSPDTAGANINNVALITKNVDAATAGSANDRISFLRFNTTGVPPVTAASLTLAVHNNAVPAGFQVQLYGIPDGGNNENFNESTVTFANNGYTTNSANNDATDNNVVDAALTLLGTYTFPTAITQGAAGTSPGTITFSDAGGALTSFLNADTNGLATFILTTPTINGTNTVAFYSRDNTTSQAVPTLATNADAIAVPEPTAAAIVTLLAATGLGRRRRTR
jgi:hypothetical protein